MVTVHGITGSAVAKPNAGHCKYMKRAAPDVSPCVPTEKTSEPFPLALQEGGLFVHRRQTLSPPSWTAMRPGLVHFFCRWSHMGIHPALPAGKSSEARLKIPAVFNTCPRHQQPSRQPPSASQTYDTRHSVEQ